jgi:hypothetical protein
VSNTSHKQSLTAEKLAAPRDHRGFIFVEHSEAYGLGSERSDNGKKMYGVSMLHQLHCLVCSEDRTLTGIELT